MVVSGKIIAAGEGVGGADCGYGVAFEPSGGGTELLICHLQRDSLPATLSGSTGTFSNTGKAQGGGPGTAGVAKDGVKLETEFKGVPKSLEILPGRTVLSFISNYDSWIENNKSNAVDPGVWIPELYKNWMVTGTTFNWDNGDLKVKLDCNRKWNVSKDTFLNNIPSFAQYNSDGKYSDYYDYIRSSGDLCYTTAGGKNSCAEFCRKKESSSGTGDGNGSPDITTSYPPGKFTYTCSKYNKANIQAIANAANSMGITSKFAIAGIIGNALQETSGVDPTAVGDGGAALGVFQWNGPRKKALEAHAAEVGGSANSINTQMSWFVREVKQSYSGMIGALNNSTSVNNATLIFEKTYERAQTPLMKNRYAYAQEIFNCLT